MARVVAQAAFTISGTLAQGIARIAIPILVGNFTNSSTLATVSVVLSVSVLLSMVWPTPAGTAASRYGVDAGAASVSALRTLRFSTILALGVVAIAGGLVIGIQTASVQLGFLAALVTAAYSAYFFTRGVFLGRFRARSLAIWEVTGALIAVAGTVASLTAGFWPGALVSLAVGYGFIAIAGWPWQLGARTPLDRSVLSFTAHNAVANAASNGMVQLAMVIVFAATVSTEAGLFAAAFSLATPASLFGQTINQVLIPHLAEQAKTERPDGRRLALQALGLAGITFVPFAVVFALSGWILGVLYPDYVAATELLHLLVVAMFLFTIALYPAAALTAWGNARELVAANATALVVGVVAMIAIGIPLGAPGVAMGLVVGTALLAVLTAFAAGRALATRS